MHKIFIFLFIFCIITGTSRAEENSGTIDLILSSAENFFVSLSDGEYETSWDLLSEESRERIIDDVYRSSLKMNKKTTKDDISNKFVKRGVFFKTYWNSFRSTFDTAMVLEHSRWNMGYIEKEKAEIIISYRKSDQPARLKMLRENNKWKVGIAETFFRKKRWNWRFYKEYL